MKKNNRRDYGSKRTVEERKEIREHQDERFKLNMSSAEGFKRLLNTNDSSNWWTVIDEIGMEYQYNRHLDQDDPRHNKYMSDPELRKSVIHRCVHLLRLRDNTDKTRPLYVMVLSRAYHPKWLPDLIDCALFVATHLDRDAYHDCFWIIEKMLEKWDAKYPYPENLKTLYEFVLDEIKSNPREELDYYVSLLLCSPNPIHKLYARSLWRQVLKINWSDAEERIVELAEKIEAHEKNNQASIREIEKLFVALNGSLQFAFMSDYDFEEIYTKYYYPQMSAESLRELIKKSDEAFEEKGIQEKFSTLRIYSHDDLRHIPNYQHFFEHRYSPGRWSIPYVSDEHEEDRQATKNILYTLNHFSESDYNRLEEDKDKFRTFLDEQEQEVGRFPFQFKSDVLRKSMCRQLRKKLYNATPFQKKVMLEIFLEVRYWFAPSKRLGQGAIASLRWAIILDARSSQDPICFRKIKEGLEDPSVEYRKILLLAIEKDVRSDTHMEPELVEMLVRHWKTVNTAEEKILILNCFKEEARWTDEQLEMFREMYLLERDDQLSEMVREKIRVIKYISKNRWNHLKKK